MADLRTSSAAVVEAAQADRVTTAAVGDPVQAAQGAMWQPVHHDGGGMS